jgi:hypothetical protein
MPNVPIPVLAREGGGNRKIMIIVLSAAALIGTARATLAQKSKRTATSNLRDALSDRLW